MHYIDCSVYDLEELINVRALLNHLFYGMKCQMVKNSLIVVTHYMLIIKYLDIILSQMGE